MSSKDSLGPLSQYQGSEWSSKRRASDGDRYDDQVPLVMRVSLKYAVDSHDGGGGKYIADELPPPCPFATNAPLSLANGLVFGSVVAMTPPQIYDLGVVEEVVSQGRM